MTTEKPRNIYITKRCGRLANRLVLFANIIAYAEEHGLRLRNYTFHTYCKDFDQTRRNFHCQYPPPAKLPWQTSLSWIGDILIKLRLYYRFADLARKFPRVFNGITIDEIPEPPWLDEPEEVSNTRPFQNIFIHSWTSRCPTYVSKHEEVIRAFLKPADHHRKAAEKIVEPLKSCADLVVGIHMRQGDYKDWLDGRFYFTSGEYAAFMKKFAEQFYDKKVSFLICSDETQEKKNFEDLTVSIGPGSPASDLFALSLCDYIIGPVSTFSQWASFYGKTPLFHLRKQQTDLLVKNFKVSDLQLLKH